MVSRSDLEEQFSSLGVEVSNAILDKCEELCINYGLDEEGLVETWMAYSLSFLDGAEPTVETLTQMERKELNKKDAPVASKQPSQTASPLLIYNASNLDSSAIQTEDILDAYSTYTTPKTKRVVKHGHGDTTPRLYKTPGQSPSSAFSPASYSSVSEPSQRYSERSNAGEVKLHFGPNAKDCSWKPDVGTSFTPKIGSYGCDSQVKGNALYMFEKVSDETAFRTGLVDYLGQQILEKCSLTDSDQLGQQIVEKCSVADPEPCGVPFQEAVYTYGRVSTEKLDNGRRVVKLEGSQVLSNGCIVDLEVGGLEASLFPGQICVVKGSNPTGHKLIAENIYTSALLPKPSNLPQFTTKQGSLQLVVAAGPYTQLDTLNYKPLEDLMKYIVEHKPHVVILIGPFIDETHPLIKDGLLAETFEAHFEKMIEKIMEPLKSLQTQVVMIPSWHDVHGVSVYPTPPFVPLKPPNNMHFMSDPSTINIEGLVVGVTSLDAIKDIGAKEAANGPRSGPRLHRLAKHVLDQQCYYPLYPTHVNVDFELFSAHAYLEVTPHILILPSELRHFAFVYEGCLIINPERLTRGMIGGVFTRLHIPPPTSENHQDFVNNISANIVSI